ncbi:MAG: hypothetical protein C4520_05960 [Candidatus Abyssobacteria bacterium SURF_5]|uniref:Glycosyltransferase RgtA/B/C/D-like domain-containing protein n=1 Tax=Abyssobacteria bacterium (strain SURF_5) TaxID=2093360 RepID=A0A3A4P2C4_ABYX5|nr:MAG: hypothetical protein C4520_05960 [Candidatus Abyssubacteria bacterium SURF_5]
MTRVGSKGLVAAINRAKGNISKSNILTFLFFLSFAYLFATGAQYNVADGSAPWLDGDYGVLIYISERLLHGEMLYRDFFSLYTPASHYLITLLFQVLGDNLQAVRIALALTGMATAFLVFHLTKKLTSIGVAVAGMLFAFILGPVSINYPYPSWFCIPLGLLMISIEHIAWRRKSAALYFAGGAVAGLIFSFKINYGVLAFSALLCIEAFEWMFDSEAANESRPQRLFSSAVAICFLLLLPFGSIVLIRHDLLLRNIAVFFVSAFLVFLAGICLLGLQLKKKLSIRIKPAPMLYSALGFLLVTIPWAAYFLNRLGPDWFFDRFLWGLSKYSQIRLQPMPLPAPEGLLLLLVFLLQGFLFLTKRVNKIGKWAFFGILWLTELLLAYKLVFYLRTEALPVGQIYSKWGFSVVNYVPLAAHIGIFFCLLKEFREPKKPHALNRTHLLLGLWVYSIAAFHTFYPIMEAYHLIWNMIPVVILVLVFLSRSVDFWRKEQASVFFGDKLLRGISASIVPLFIAAFFGLPMLNFFVKIELFPPHIAPARFDEIDSARAGIVMPEEQAHGMNGALRFIASQTSPDEYILDGTGSLFYFLSDRQNPTGWFYYETVLLTPADIIQYKMSVEQRKPRVAVTSYASEIHLSHSLPEIYEYFLTEYRPIMMSGDYRLWVLKDS